MKKVKKQVKEGDIFPVEFIPNNKGGKPVCSVDGLIGFIRNGSKEKVVTETEWLVEVVEVFPKYIIVDPLFESKNRFVLQKEKEEKLKKLNNKFSKKRKEHKKKKVHYPYLSSTERKSKTNM